MSHVAHISNLPEALDGQGRLQVAAADADALLTKIADFAGQGQNDISDDGTDRAQASPRAGVHRMFCG